MSEEITKTFMHRITDKKVIVDFLNTMICNRTEFSEGGIDKYTSRLIDGLSTIQAKAIQEVAGIIHIFAGYNRDVITINKYEIIYNTRSRTKVTIDAIDIYYTIKVGISKDGVIVTDDNINKYYFSLVPRYCTIGDACPDEIKGELLNLEYFMGFDLHVEKKGE